MLINKCKVIIVYVILLIVSLVPIYAHSSTFYVDNVKGSDSNSGQKLLPWATINKAMSSVLPGDDVVIVSNGTNNPYKEQMVIAKSGRPGNPLTIRGELSSKKPVIVGDGKNVLFVCSNKEYVEIKDLAFRNTKSTALKLISSSNVRVLNVEVKNAGQNGIIVTKGGSNITIDGCEVSDVINSGIVIHGTEYPLTDTLIQNCKIKNVATNDGITLHQNSSGYDVGANHIIRNNILSNCAEQGIDITSGTHVTLDSNETFKNGTSGIIVGNNVRNIKVVNNLVRDEPKYGIVIGNASDVSIVGNKVINTGSKAALYIYKCNGITIQENSIVFPSDRVDGSVIDLYYSDNMKFIKNKFKVSNLYTGNIVRWFAAIPEIGQKWENNTWFLPSPDSIYVYTFQDGKIAFRDFMVKYSPNDSIVSIENDSSVGNGF